MCGDSSITPCQTTIEDNGDGIWKSIYNSQHIFLELHTTISRMRVIQECLSYTYDKVKLNIKNFNRIISFVTPACMCTLMMRNLKTLTGFGAKRTATRSWHIFVFSKRHELNTSRCQSFVSRNAVNWEMLAPLFIYNKCIK